LRDEREKTKEKRRKRKDEREKTKEKRRKRKDLTQRTQREEHRGHGEVVRGLEEYPKSGELEQPQEHSQE
jgi:hypothetical protein